MCAPLLQQLRQPFVVDVATRSFIIHATLYTNYYRFYSNIYIVNTYIATKKLLHTCLQSCALYIIIIYLVFLVLVDLLVFCSLVRSFVRLLAFLHSDCYFYFIVVLVDLCALLFALVVARAEIERVVVVWFCLNNKQM